MEAVQWLGGNRWRAAAALALFVLIGIPLHLGLKRATWAENPNLLPLNTRAPLLQGPNLAGEYYDSALDRGLVRVFVFLDPTRSAGAKQMRAMQAWREDYPDGRLRLVTVFTGGDESAHRHFAEKYSLNEKLTVFDRGGTRAPKFRAKNTPTIYVVDGTNVIRYATDKYVSGGNMQLREIIEGYLPPEGGRAQRRVTQ
ncbi:MAG TPA: redoxin domain-containing protein [bacterium]|nr:redoxin domain-containing protein [bacterium]